MLTRSSKSVAARHHEETIEFLDYRGRNGLIIREMSGYLGD